MKLVDTHSHLYAKVFDEDFNEVLQRCLKSNISKIILPNIDSESSADLMRLCKDYPDLFLGMMGVHPCHIQRDSMEKELDEAKKLLFEGSFCAVGEIGIDLYWDKTTLEIQQQAFETQIGWAIEKNLPICIHSRNATRECIEIVKPYIPKGLKGVFHCFSGSIEEALEIIDFGFFLGIGGVITFKNGGLQPILEQLDLSHIMLETDSPYLAPVPYRGKRNESAYTAIVAHTLASIKQISVEEVAEITTFNAEKLFQFSA
jgi:TatD DNase family protein